MKVKTFTLVETILALTLMSFIVLGSISTLNFLSSGREKVEAHLLVRQELRQIKNLIQKDLNNLFRSLPKKRLKFICIPDESPEARPMLVFYCSHKGDVRPNSIESDFYEVQYGLIEQEDDLKFIRRLWPVPDSQKEEMGGVLMVLSEKIVSFSLRFLDGEDEWVPEWTEEMEELPQLVEVSLSAQLNESSSAIASSFYVHFPRFEDFDLGGF